MLKRFLWVAAVVLVANAGALAVVARNARGAPDAAVTLTEREIRLTSVEGDTTGMTLIMQWNRRVPLPWFDRAKLTSLGFDCSVDPTGPGAQEYYSGPALAPRTAYIVLEYDPSRLGETEPATETPPANKATAVEPAGNEVAEYASRLRAVDAGSDPRALRAKYADAHRYIVTAGVVRPTLDRASAYRPVRLRGLILEVLPDQIYVPQELTSKLLAAMGKAGNRESLWVPLRHAPRYEVRVEYGSGLLPRIVDVKAIGSR
jgi:hypothetical protein